MGLAFGIRQDGIHDSFPATLFAKVPHFQFDAGCLLLLSLCIPRLHSADTILACVTKGSMRGRHAVWLITTV